MGLRGAGLSEEVLTQGATQSSNASSGSTPVQIKDEWYLYDSENRIKLSGGVLSGTAGAVETTIRLEECFDIEKIQLDTMGNPDRVYSDVNTRATVFEKRYDFDISQSVFDVDENTVAGASRVHKVFVSPDPASSTQFPLAPRHHIGVF
ncbi:MAG: hypothetical protein ACOYXU_01955 [Nitrospirota bacterium]